MKKMIWEVINDYLKDETRTPGEWWDRNSCLSWWTLDSGDFRGWDGYLLVAEDGVSRFQRSWGAHVLKKFDFWLVSCQESSVGRKLCGCSIRKFSRNFLRSADFDSFPYLLICLTHLLIFLVWFQSWGLGDSHKLADFSWICRENCTAKNPEGK